MPNIFARHEYAKHEYPQKSLAKHVVERTDLQLNKIVVSIIFLKALLNN